MPPFFSPLVSCILPLCTAIIVTLAPSSPNGIAGAIANASSGDIIQLSAGIYDGNKNCDIRIAINNLNLLGIDGPENTIIDCGHNSRCLSVIGVAANIGGIQFRNGRAPNIPTDEIIASKSPEMKTSLRKSLLPQRRSSRSFVFSIQVFVTMSGDLVQEIAFQPRKRQEKPTVSIESSKESSQIDDYPRKTYSKLKAPALATPAMFIPDSTQFKLKATVQDSTGGCVFILGGASVVISNVIIAGGQALNGSGIAVADSRVNIKGSNLESNGISASSDVDLFGAGGYFINSSVMISNTNISNNFLRSKGNSRLFGAGLYFFSSSNVSLIGPITISNCSLLLLAISANAKKIGSLRGGGIYSRYCNNLTLRGTVTISNCSLLSTVTGGNGFLLGGGVYFDYAKNTSFFGPITISNCIIRFTSQLGKSGLEGAGIYSQISSYSSFIGPITISNCSLISSGSGTVFGGALAFSSNNDASFIGPIEISANSIRSDFNLLSPLLPSHYTQPPNATVPQCNAVTITQTDGSLDDGSFESFYAPSLYCSWLLSPPGNIQYSYVFEVLISTLETEKGYDFLYLYDGPTSLSPALGQYSGTIGNYLCSSGQCPSIHRPIISSSGQLLIVFSSDAGVQYGGFFLNWTMIPVNRTNGHVGVMLVNFDSYPFLDAGAGMAFISCNGMKMSNLEIMYNSIISSGLSVGGGLFFDASLATISNLSFRGNMASGFQCGGGAMGVYRRSNVISANCTLRQNNAVAEIPLCIYLAGFGVLCPSVFGGSVLVATGAAFSMHWGSVAQSSSSCQTHTACNAFGGAVAVMYQSSNFSISFSSCSESSTISINNSEIQGWNAGGCLYFQDSAGSINNSTIFNNSVGGISSGGGIFIAGSSAVDIFQSMLFENVGRIGGGIGISDESVLQAGNCSLFHNRAASIGGAIFVKGDASVGIKNTSFFSNVAPTSSTIFAFNENNKASYTFSNFTAIVPLGSIAIMLGSLQFENIVYTCSQPGTVLNHDITNEFFSLTCEICSSGTYAVGFASTYFVDRKCQPCPFGAFCNGSSPESNGLLALGGFWGFQNGENVHFYPCPSGYCCPVNEKCPYNHCEGDRTGMLCGQCPQGSGLRFFTEGCKSDEHCKDATWFAWVIIICAVIAVLLLLATAGSQSSGMLSVLLYFYQVFPLIKSTPWKYTSPTLLVAIQSVFNFSPSGDSNSNGVCLVTSMTTSQKLGSRLLLQGVIFATIGVIFLLHSALARLRVTKWFALHPARLSHYMATAARFCTIAYTTLVLVSLQMIQCVTIDDAHVWWWDATVECYQRWQKAGFVGIAILLPLPVGMTILMWRYWMFEESLSQKWKREIFKVLSGGFRPEKRWWLGISLYRRFLLVLAYSTIIDRNWRCIATSTLCLIFLATNFVVIPFKSAATNRSESMSLIILAIVAVTTSPQGAQIQFGSSTPIFDEGSLERIQFILALAPAVCYCLFSSYRLRNYYCKKKDIQSESELREDHVNAALNVAAPSQEDDFGFFCWEHQYC